jgi:hypothetical protein
MTTSFSISISRLAAGAAALAAGLLAFAPASWAQGVATLSGAAGNSCSYTSVTTLPNGNITVTCGAAANSATITIGTVGSLDAGLPSNVSVPVNCTGTGCNGVAISVAINPARPGVSLIGGTTHTYTAAGSQSFTVGGDGTTTVGSATFEVTLTDQGTATSTTPAVNGTVVKSVPIVDVMASGTLSFSPVLASVTEGAAAVNVSVLRTGSGAQSPAESVAYSCSVLPAGYTPGFTPAASGTLNWAAGNATAKIITINPTTVPDTVAGTVTCTLGATTGGAVADTTPFVLTVNKAGGGGTCTTVADQNLSLASGTATKVTASASGVKTSATNVATTRNGGTLGYIALTYPAAGSGTNTPTGMQYNLSACPGDFTTTMAPGCGPFFNTRGNGTLKVTTTAGTTQCHVEAGKTYYMNVRFVNPATGVSTCASGTCGAFVVVNYN